MGKYTTQETTHYTSIQFYLLEFLLYMNFECITQDLTYVSCICAFCSYMEVFLQYIRTLQAALLPYCSSAQAFFSFAWEKQNKLSSYYIVIINKDGLFLNSDSLEILYSLQLEIFSLSSSNFLSSFLFLLFCLPRFLHLFPPFSHFPFPNPAFIFAYSLTFSKCMLRI